MWLALTLAFELALGRAVGLSWDRIWSDFDPRRGGLLAFGMLVMAVGPRIVAARRGLAQESFRNVGPGEIIDVMDAEFRTATPGDAESIIRFWLESGASMSVTDTVEDVRRVTANPAARIVLAVAGDGIVGTLLGTFDGWRGNMYRLVVRSDQRRRGIGRQLVHQMERLFAAWGVRRVTVLIEVDRPWAVAFWSAVGYPRDERIVRHVGTLSEQGEEG